MNFVFYVNIYTLKPSDSLLMINKNIINRLQPSNSLNSNTYIIIMLQPFNIHIIKYKYPIKYVTRH